MLVSVHVHELIRRHIHRNRARLVHDQTHHPRHGQRVQHDGDHHHRDSRHNNGGDAEKPSTKLGMNVPQGVKMHNPMEHLREQLAEAEHHEEASVATADAVRDPYAVMVKLVHTHVAQGAMLCSQWPYHPARVAHTFETQALPNAFRQLVLNLLDARVPRDPLGYAAGVRANHQYHQQQSQHGGDLQHDVGHGGQVPGPSVSNVPKRGEAHADTPSKGEKQGGSLFHLQCLTQHRFLFCSGAACIHRVGSFFFDELLGVL
mmetsp:Transcript_32022/g.76810  ORF Transcript_32022/g.76810 Transcript_32022/m.76810 type:complete len:260 (-) Transcript_32022:590-1369(-)